MEAEIALTMHADVVGVLRWFLAALQPLSGVRYREGPGVEVVLGEPREENPRPPGIVAGIVIPALRVRSIPVHSDWGLIEGWRREEGPLEPVMRLRFGVLAGQTCVVARCDAPCPPVLEAFSSLLQRAQARYPEIAEHVRAYETGRIARMKEEMLASFTAPAAPPTVEAAPSPEPPVRRRGRKRADPKEINKICADWLRLQDRVTQINFCIGRGISPSTLRSWLKHYPHPER